jgi:hypothetical protein
VLANPASADNPFFLLFPDWLLIPAGYAGRSTAGSLNPMANERHLKLLRRGGGLNRAVLSAANLVRAR